MLKKISLSILVILIILIGGYTFYWFDQAKKLEKETMVFLNSHGKNSARSVSISGFPFKNILTIEDLKIVSSGDSKSKPQIQTQTFNPTSTIFKQSSYSLEVGTIRFSNKLFTNNITVDNIGDIKIQKNNQNPYLLKFNQSPIIDLVFDRNLVTNLDYRGKGYAIFDAQNNEIVRIDGDSRMISDLMATENGFNGKINITSSGINKGNFGRLSALFDEKEQSEKAPFDLESSKHEIKADIEYVLLLKEKPQSEDELYQTNKFKIESVNVKNIEIANENIRVSAKGFFSKALSEKDPSYDFTVNFENLGYVIDDAKRLYKEMMDAKKNKILAQEKKNDLVVTNNQNTNVSTPSNPLESTTSPDLKPQIDVDDRTVDMFDNAVNFITYVASQNPATNEKNSTFNFKKDNTSKVMLINGIGTDQLIMQFFMMISASKEVKTDQNPVILDQQPVVEQNNNPQILQ